MNMKVKDGLGLAIIWVQQDLTLAYEDNCPLRPVKTGSYSLKWSSELESLRKGVRQLFNMWRTDKNPQSWELYREAQRRCRKEVRKASKDAWRTFCSSIHDLPMTTRLHRALSRDPKIKLGSSVDPLGRHMQSKGETLEHFLATHFRNSVVTEEEEEEAANVAAHCAKCLDLWVAARVVTYTSVEQAIDSFAPYKCPGMAGIFPPCCKRDREFRSHTWSKCFMPAWQLATFQPYGARVRRCSYLSLVVTPIADQGTLDLTVSHCSYIRPWTGWQIFEG